MNLLQLVELVAAALILAGGVFLYRRRPAKDDAGDEGDDGGHYGSQGAVLLFVIAIIIAIHGSGALEYHPSASEIETYQGLKGLTGH